MPDAENEPPAPVGFQKIGDAEWLSMTAYVHDIDWTIHWIRNTDFFDRGVAEKREKLIWWNTGWLLLQLRTKHAVLPMRVVLLRSSLPLERLHLLCHSSMPSLSRTQVYILS